MSFVEELKTLVVGGGKSRKHPKSSKGKSHKVKSHKVKSRKVSRKYRGGTVSKGIALSPSPINGGSKKTRGGKKTKGGSQLPALALLGTLLAVGKKRKTRRSKKGKKRGSRK